MTEQNVKRITDELREFIDDGYPAWKLLRKTVHVIADRIDAAHEDALSRLYMDMSDSEWVRLPKDADGEVIHVGDNLHDGWHELNRGEVEWLMLDRHGWWLRFKSGCERFYVHEFHEWRHHHKQPTVEDVLRDMHAKLDEVTALYVGEAIDSDERDSDEARIFAEYAAKMRLADNGKEQ